MTRGQSARLGGTGVGGSVGSVTPGRAFLKGDHRGGKTLVRTEEGMEVRVLF